MYCADCGKEVAAGRSFCANCGAPAPVTSNEQPTQPTTPIAEENDAPPFSLDLAEPGRGGRGAIVMIVIVVLLIVAVAVAAIMFILKDEEAASSTTTEFGVTTTVLGVTTTVPPTETTTGPATTLAPGGVVDLVDLAVRASDIEASSVLSDQGSTTYMEANLVDNMPGTCWAENVPGYGVDEYIDFTWTGPVTLRQVRIVPGYDKEADGWDRWTSNGRVRTFGLVFSDGTSESFTVTDTRPPQTLTFAAPHTVSSVRLVITGYFEAAPGPRKAEDTSVSELHFWGTE